jgi:putative membrane protein
MAAPAGRRHAQRITRATLAALTVAGALLGAGCADRPATGATAAADAPRPLSETDRRFVIEAAGSGQYQVEAARLAEQRTKDAMVKAYAVLLGQQHGDAVEELRALAQARGFALPTGIPAERRATLEALGALAIEVFDRRFVEQVGIADHQADLVLFEAASRGAEDATLRAWAARMLPVLQNQLASAQQLPVSVRAGMEPPSSLALATPPGGRPPTARQSRFRGGKLGRDGALATRQVSHSNAES